jgi:hypothetical protein
MSNFGLQMGMGISLARASGPASMDTTAADRVAQLKTAGATVSVMQAMRISNFIRAEKAAGRWSSHKRIFIPGWGVAAANAIDLVTGAVATFPNGATHGAGFVQGNSANQYCAFGVSPSALGMTSSSTHLWALLKTLPSGIFQGFVGASSGGNGDCFFGHGSAGPSFTCGTYPSMEPSVGAKSGILCAIRDATKWEISQRSSAGFAVLGTTTGATVGTISSANLVAMQVTPSQWTNAIQFGAFGCGTSISDVSGFTANLKALWERLFSLALP